MISNVLVTIVHKTFYARVWSENATVCVLSVSTSAIQIRFEPEDIQVRCIVCNLKKPKIKPRFGLSLAPKFCNVGACVQIELHEGETKPNRGNRLLIEEEKTKPIVMPDDRKYKKLIVNTHQCSAYFVYFDSCNITTAGASLSSRLNLFLFSHYFSSKIESIHRFSTSNLLKF